MQSSVERSCLNLVNNVLDAAKLKAEKMELSYTRTDFSELLKKVLMINSENLSKSSVIVRGFIDRSLPKALWIDPFRILQIIMNLTSNAIKFSKQKWKDIHLRELDRGDRQQRQSIYVM